MLTTGILSNSKLKKKCKYRSFLSIFQSKSNSKLQEKVKRGCFYSLSINNLVIKGKMILNIPEKSKGFIDNLYFYIKNSKMQKDIVFMHIVLKALFLREN